MKKILLHLIFITFSVTLHAQNPYFNVRLTNYEGYTKYVLVKYMNKNGNYVKKEVKLSKNSDFRLKIYDKSFYLYSVSFHRGGKVRAGTYGKDGISYFRTMIKGKTAYYRKIDCEMQLRGFFKTVHLGI